MPTALSDGRAALVLTHTAPTPGGLVLAIQELAEALAATPCDVIVLRPEGVDVADALAAAVTCGPSHPLLATPREVTDAVKQVRGDLLRRTLDRAALRWATSPAVIDIAHMQTVLALAEGPLVRPLRRQGPDAGASGPLTGLGWIGGG